MKRSEFEAILTELWIKSQIPLTLENLVGYTEEKPRTIEKWLRDLDEMGAIEQKADSSEWLMRGRARPMDGPETLDQYRRLERLRSEAKERVRSEWVAKQKKKLGAAEPLEEIGAPSEALARRSDSIFDSALAKQAVGQLKKEVTSGEKNLLVAGGTSFLFGPLGWLYAGAWREAVPASAAWLAIAALVPSFLLMPLLFFIMPASGLVGLGYAWKYNKSGKRTRMLTKGSKKPRKP